MDAVDATDPDGVVVTLGGQTPLKLARALEEAGVPIMGTSPDAIDLAEDRDRFAALLDSLDIAYPRSAMASGLEEARSCCPRDRLSLARAPQLRARRPGHGHRLRRRGASRAYVAEADRRSPRTTPCIWTSSWKAPWNATWTPCATARTCTSAASWSTSRWPASTRATRPAACRPSRCRRRVQDGDGRAVARRIALALGVRGLVNIQSRREGRGRLRHRGQPAGEPHGALHLEGHGRALSEAPPAASWRGRSLAALKLPEHFAKPGRYFVKEAVMPFGRFPGADALLGPEMRSTGEVMGIAESSPGGLYEDPDGHRLRRA